MKALNHIKKLIATFCTNDQHFLELAATIEAIQQQKRIWRERGKCYLPWKLHLAVNTEVLGCVHLQVQCYGNLFLFFSIFAYVFLSILSFVNPNRRDKQIEIWVVFWGTLEFMKKNTFQICKFNKKIK